MTDEFECKFVYLVDVVHELSENHGVTLSEAIQLYRMICEHKAAAEISAKLDEIKNEMQRLETRSKE